ncbi:hypothetical protein IWW48_006305 [Coemansia sp. RSA 1200]|nr:hypothetical protein IWW48_006305 [Coemansia sp. RSA 1200]
MDGNNKEKAGYNKHEYEYDGLMFAVRKKMGVSKEEFEACPLSAQQYMVRSATEQVDREEAEASREYVRREVEVAMDGLRARGIMPQSSYPRPLPPRVFHPHRDVLQLSSEFVSNEPDPEQYLGGRLLGFRKKTLLELEPRVREMVDRAISLQSDPDQVERGFHSYMALQIWRAGASRASTPIVTVADNRGSHIEDRLKELHALMGALVAEIERESAGYEYLYEGPQQAHAHFYYCMATYPRVRASERWGHVMPVEKRQFFDIFTASANNTDTPGDCVAQCAQRIALRSSDLRHVRACTTMDELKAVLGERLCVLKLHAATRGICDVQDYTDLVVANDSPWQSFSVVDTDRIYMVRHNGHVGLLEELREQKRRRFFTTFRPLHKFPKCKRVTVFFDIECFFDPRADQRHVPYLCCACLCYDDVPGNVVEHTGKDCVASMLDYVADICTQMEHAKVELIAHNGGGYDFHYILNSMPDPSIVTNILVRNNNFIGFKFVHRGVEFGTKDSLHFLTCSLSRAAQSFLGERERKTDFPHHEVLTAADLQREMHEWLSVDTVVSANLEKEHTMVVAAEHIVRYGEGGPAHKLIDWARQYCRNDVIVLAKVWIAFKTTVNSIFACPIVDQTHTLAGMSFRLLEAHMPAKRVLRHPAKADFVNMRAALVGGRCISMNGLYHKVVCLDVKSLYPAAMAFYDQPYGQYRKVKAYVPDELGIYFVSVSPRGQRVNGFFPLRTHDGSVTYSSYPHYSHSQYSGWYTSVDIDIGLSEGHKIAPIPFDAEGHVGYSWKNKGKIFAEYINRTLYRLKLQYEQAGDAEKRHVIKIIMNSLWGKFAQKWMDTQYKVVHEDAVEAELAHQHQSSATEKEEDRKSGGEAFKIWDTDHMLVKSRKNKIIADKPVQNGVFVLSWARHHMKRLWNACIKQDAVCLYSDTDSIIVRQEDIVLDSPHIGDQMGQLEIETFFDTFITVGKKQYIGSFIDAKGKLCYKKRFKGVPQQYIVPEMYTYLLQDPDNRVQIDFLKFKRDWGVVRGFIESKTVSAT